MKRKEKLKKFAKKAFPIIWISAISATFALALNARLKKNDYYSKLKEIEKKIQNLVVHYNSHVHYTSSEVEIASLIEMDNFDGVDGNHTFTDEDKLWLITNSCWKGRSG